jgi:Ni,Fe-hydrogenase III large subunit
MNDMTQLTLSLSAFTSADTNFRPWPHFRLSVPQWAALVDLLQTNPSDLLSEWSDGDRVYALFWDAATASPVVASVAAEGRQFASLSAVRPGAIRLERAIQELHGLTALGLTDPRPWLDHDAWGVRYPETATPAQPLASPTAYQFLPVNGPDLHQIPVGPVHAGIIEPGHFRFTLNGELVVRMEERMGYTHKGVFQHMKGKSLTDAARIAGRLSGDSTVAHGLAFAQAVEAALDVSVPLRAVWLRALAAELERLANHIWDIGAICNDVALAYMLAECGVLRENVLQLCDDLFGHRMMMDLVVPGGVSGDVSPQGAALISAFLTAFRQKFAPLLPILNDLSSLLDRTVTTGITKPAYVQAYAAGGFVGRAAGRSFDARKDVGYAPYPELPFTVQVLQDGDVHARLWVRVREVEESLNLIEYILPRIPMGGLMAELLLPTAPIDGSAIVEAFRGESVAWVRVLPNGTVGNVFIRDASWLQWPLLETALEGNIVADFPVCNKSFNCSYSGQDI